MSENVRQFKSPEATPQISIDFSPHREAFSYSAGGTTYSPSNVYYAHIGETVTFTATVVPNSTQRILGYEWDFGDNTKGFGQVATHTYGIDNTHLQVTLMVTDDSNRKWYGYKYMYLREP